MLCACGDGEELNSLDLTHPHYENNADTSKYLGRDDGRDGSGSGRSHLHTSHTNMPRDKCPVPRLGG
jgi:hypothetical protein